MMIENENIVIDSETGQVINNKPSKKDKKNHPVLICILSLVISLAGGFAGGYIAVKNTAHTVIYKNETPTAPASFDDPTSLQSVIASVKDSVVEINTEVVSETNDYFGFFGMPSQQVIQEGAGSGVIISTDGYIITNNHVIEGATNINVRLTDGNVYPATLIGTDSKSDIAVVKIEANGLSPATIGDSDKLLVGDDVIAIGNPLGSLGGTATNGIISALNRQVTVGNESMNLIQTNAAINEGNSGGALFNANGELVGIVNAKSYGTAIEGLGFAIPINDAIDVAQQLIESGHVTDRATLGVYVTELKQDSNGYKAGLYISDTIEGGAASNAGLQPYDRIIALNDVEISNYTDLSNVLKDYKVGDTVTLTVVREGKQLNVEVTLTQPIVTSDEQ
ncbi:MAG: trypsin-like peptidase domain-containing protein [Erysipelotrichaceae bacterium]|nr:trypsin-like peptidase domain-containing protein [Erysipelotrichaceae bacterium]MDY5251550.1 trypsin-like peptidase domain-containing protein [Erysipelotrichaceae bacterium]